MAHTVLFNLVFCILAIDGNKFNQLIAIAGSYRSCDFPLIHLRDFLGKDFRQLSEMPLS